MLFDLLANAYAAVFGLAIGSYLNVVIHRLPRGLSTIAPRSRCPVCRSAIRHRDNVPVLSYLLLGGRCRCCWVPISPRYALVEALTAVLFVGCLQAFGISLGAMVAMLFVSLLVALAGIDLDHYILPDRLTLPGIAVGLLLQPWAPWTDFAGALIGTLAGGGVLLAVWGLWYLLRREEGMGLGDVKMLAMVGAFLGWKGMAVTFLVATAAGALIGVALIVSGRSGRRAKLPFGVFLSLGALVGLFWGPPLVDAYLELL
ncbi:MAG: prepilin peptidase [Acidobacteriota bacterium]